MIILNKLKSILSGIFTKVISFLMHKEQYTILVLLILLNIKEKNNAKNKRFFSNPSKKITILALDSNRYRGDLDVLSCNTGLRVLFMDQRPTGWLIKPFYIDLRESIEKYNNAEKGSDYAIRHAKAYEFHRKFLNVFYRYVSIDCVTTLNYKYLWDYNWTKASENIGIPFIMLYRECLLSSDRLYDRIVINCKNFGKFHGSHIIVQNKKCKQVFIDSDFTSSDKISVVGALRMDKFIDDIGQNKYKEAGRNEQKKFIFFYFPYDISLFGRSKKAYPGLAEKYKYHSKVWSKREEFFIDVHNVIIELAKEYPAIEFIIKPKKIMVESKSWSFYKDVIDRSKIDVKKLTNYKVDENIDTGIALISSDVVSVLQTSVLAEAALAGNRVIIPLFYDFLNTPYFNDFSWKRYIDLFDIATDKNEFKRLFEDILDNPIVSEDIQHKRIEMFEEWFGNINSNSSDKYYNIIKNILE